MADVDAVGRLPRLGEDETRLFAWLAQHDDADLRTAGEHLALTPERVARALTALITLHLVHRRPGEERWAPIAPDAAIATLVAPQEVALRTRLAEIDRMRSELSRLTPLYSSARRADCGDDLRAVLDLDTVVGLIAEATAHCRTRVRTCHPGGGRSPMLLEQAFARDHAMLERGVEMRTLYQHTARHHAPTQEYVRRAVAAGAHVRTLSELFGRMIAFDSDVVFIPHLEDPDGAVVLREPSTVAYLCAVFDHAWSLAEPYSPAWPASSARDEIKQAIVRLLAQGHKDEVIARRLAMSLRTCRKHIAEIMDDVGATSRFQAGYRIRGETGAHAV